VNPTQTPTQPYLLTQFRNLYRREPGSTRHLHIVAPHHDTYSIMTREDDALHSIEEPLSHSQSAIVDGHSTEPSPDSSAVVSEDDGRGRSSSRLGRPKLGSRKSSGTMIVSRDAPTTVVDSDFEDDDVRAMSPRRNSEEVDKLGEDARRDLIAQAQMLQTSLQAIVDRVETVKTEHEKLEGGNKFLQSYIGELMQTSKITSSAPPKKGKNRIGK